MTATQIVLDALRATATGDLEQIEKLYAPDCHGWSAGVALPSREDITANVSDHAAGLSDVRVEASPAELPGGTVVAEWRLTARHTGDLDLGDDVHVPATGRTVDLRGAIFAEVTGDQITSFRQYWDEADLLDQLGLLPEDD